MQGTLGAEYYRSRKGELLDAVLASYRRLRAAADVVIVEGAGSLAEINLRKGDIANMGFARAADVPVILVGDIDCGGVIASIAGTKTVIDHRDASMLKDFLIHKSRDAISLFDEVSADIDTINSWKGYRSR